MPTNRALGDAVTPDGVQFVFAVNRLRRWMVCFGRGGFSNVYSFNVRDSES